MSDAQYVIISLLVISVPVYLTFITHHYIGILKEESRYL